MALYVGYEPATGDGGGATSGARALMSWYLGAYGDRTAPKAANLGIYNPKRLSGGWSLHAEGRAGDLGTAPYSVPPWGGALAEQLRLHSRELGIQLIIFNRRVWSGSYPEAGWREYHGSDPHAGHLHVELSRAAAKSLTVEKIELAIGGTTVPVPPPLKPKPAPGPVVAFPLPSGYYFGPKSGPAKSVSGYYGRRFGAKTDRQWLKTWADQMARRGWQIGKGKRWLPRYGNDGYWGAEYEALVRAFQSDQKLKVTGRLNASTWNAAYRNPVT